MKREIDRGRCWDTSPIDEIELEIDRKRSAFILKKRIRQLAGTRKLGVLWLVLDPIVMALIYMFVFTIIRSNPSFTTLLIGITLYRIFSESTKSGVNSIQDFSGGFKSERVRTGVLTSATIKFRIIDSALKSCGAAIILFFSSGVPVEGILAYLLLAQILGLLSEGVGLNLALVARKVPDLTNVVNHALLLGFFVSPTLYPMSVTEGLHYRINEFNPFAIFVEAARFFGEVDSVILEMEIGILSGVLILFTILGFRGFSTIDRLRWEVSSWS